MCVCACTQVLHTVERTAQCARVLHQGYTLAHVRQIPTESCSTHNSFERTYSFKTKNKTDVGFKFYAYQSVLGS